MSRCVKALIDHIVLGLRGKGVVELHPYKLEDAINGSCEDAYLRRINASTGAGYNWKGKKDNYIPIVFEDEKSVIREPITDLKKSLVQRTREYQSEVSSGTVFGSKLKDEPREISKALAGKTRMFYPAPVDALILARQVLIPIFTAMVQHREIFSTAVGVNMFQEGDIS